MTFPRTSVRRLASPNLVRTFAATDAAVSFAPHLCSDCARRSAKRFKGAALLMRSHSGSNAHVIYGQSRAPNWR